MSRSPKEVLAVFNANLPKLQITIPCVTTLMAGGPAFTYDTYATFTMDAVDELAP